MTLCKFLCNSSHRLFNDSIKDNDTQVEDYAYESENNDMTEML